MPQYVRAFVPGGTFFFTVNLLERRRHLLVEHVDALRAAFVMTRGLRPFSLDAVVVLPDHLHCLWTLPPGDADFSSRWHSIKSSFSRNIPAGERLSARRLKKGGYPDTGDARQLKGSWRSMELDASSSELDLPSSELRSRRK